LIARKPYILLLALSIFLIACQDLDKTEKPDNLIPEEKMVDVLTELSLVHAAKNYNKFKLEQTGIQPDKFVFEKYDIDSLQFEQSSNYYSDQYVIYERIYDSVRGRIKVLKSKYDSLREVEIKREDSLKRLQKDSLQMMDSIMAIPRLRDSVQRSRLKLKDDIKGKEEKRDSLIAPVSMREDRN